MTFSLITYNLWGYGTPSEYLKRRGILRGAVAGSKAAHHGPADSVWGKRRARIVRTLADADPDVVAIQENARRPGAPERSHVRQIGKSLGMTVVEGTFFPMTDSGGQACEVSLALLSHLPVEAVTEAELFPGSHLDGEGIPLILQVTLDLGGESLHVWVAHFPVRTEERKLECARRVIDEAASLPSSRPLLLCGDLNAVPDTPTHRLLTEAPSPFLDLWPHLHPNEDGPTMPSQEPAARLDYILLREGQAVLEPEQAEIVGDEPDGEGFFGSDHLGVQLTFRDTF